MTIVTSIGDAVVLHRLALAVECVDATTRRLVTNAVRITRDDSGTVLAEHGPGRGVLLHDKGLPSKLAIRIADRARQFVPRRLSIPLWTLLEVSAADSDGGPFVPAVSRLLRPWLLPGSAYPLVRGATAVRGRVQANGAAVRWPRVVATDHDEIAVGWAHGDERGEFAMMLEVPKVPPTMPDSFEVTLTVSAAANPAAPGEDPLADLVVEEVPRPAAPPAPTAAEQLVLQGRATPPSYRTSVPGTRVTARLGTCTTLNTPVPFVA
jgi:hypothetical protein